MYRRPLIAVTAAWTAGLAVALLHPSGSMALCLGAALAATGFCLYSGRRPPSSAGRAVRWAAMLWAALVIGTLYGAWTEGRNVSLLPQVLETAAGEPDGAPVAASGIIVSTVERDGDKVSFKLKLGEIRDGRTGHTETAGTTGTTETTGTIGTTGIAGIAGATRNTGTTGGLPSLSESGSDEEQADANSFSERDEIVQVQLKLAAEEEIGIVGGWQRGDRIRLAGNLEQPAGPRNFGGFDYRRYLHNHRIHWLLTAQGASQAKVTPLAGFSLRLPLRWADRLRSGMALELDRIFDDKDAGYLKGLIIGMQDDLDPGTYRDFSKLGLTHILAISGMHVAVFVGCLLFLLARLRLTRETSLTAALLLVPLYVLLTGAGPSVIRAGLMSMIGLYASRRGVLKDGLHLLCAAGLMMLLWNPYHLTDVGFQLSFLVTAGLLVFVPLAAPLLSALPKRLRGAVAVTAAAQLVSFPLTICYFNQFALLSFAANLALVPFISFVVLPAGTAALLLAPVWKAGASGLAYAVHGMNRATFAAVDGCADLAGSMIWPSPSPLWIAAYYGLLYGLLKSLSLRADRRNAPVFGIDETRPLNPGLLKKIEAERRKGTNDVRSRALGLSASLLAASLAGLLVFGYRTAFLSAEGSVSFLDVGQGDSILIETPSGGHILVDGGGTVSFGKKEPWRMRRDPYEVGRKTLVPLLKKRGIHRLDAVILTHGDQDHAGGLQAVLEEIPVSALLFNGTIADTDAYRKLMQTALDKKVRLYAVHRGMRLAPDGSTTLEFLGPEGGEGAAGTNGGERKELPVCKEQNNRSVVFKLTLSGRSFLFTGDMEKEQERDTVAAQAASRSGTAPAEHVDVLKVAHHGSRTSSSEQWLRYWNPAAAVISVGKNNLYGHPGQEVLSRLTAAGTEICRTDRQGEVQMRIEDGTLQVRHRLEEPAQAEPTRQNR
ncbi:DNA internalization-related competence protein ComEC/Rec2 [Paenibacillus glufosinatiresistens]|uniref:DNA internalization-related competence protein ComEC/Rec2 n=1 Tax=Paenibacillus glufosinatiresistens TaxID=3070657 RepID=UPI00286E5E03|nr:DNA internalization-related competence protein ComEC/Rec2 [Paenibacillus sp. YX.27]